MLVYAPNEASGTQSPIGVESPSDLGVVRKDAHWGSS